MFKGILVIFISLLNFDVYSQDIIELKTQKTVNLSQLLVGELEGKTLVMGEYHYDKKILNAHAKIIWELVTRDSLQNKFSTAWEFLEYDHYKSIQLAFSDWKSSKITDIEYLKRLFPKAKKPEANLPYLDFMAATAKLGGNLIATNANRQTKKVLMEQGIQALPAKDQPTHNFQGSKNYFTRFKSIMGNHVPADMIQKYFDAQVYTDNIIGTYVENYQEGLTTFLIIGGFHSDYNDGVVRYLKQFSSNEIVSLKLINKNELTPQQLSELKKPHPTYGYIADYLVIVE